MSEFIHPPELSIFAQPWLNQGVCRVQHIDYRPVAQLSDDTVVECVGHNIYQGVGHNI
jgi:hypothetical protein